MSMERVTVTVEVEEDWTYHGNGQAETRQRDVEVYKQVIDTDATALIREIALVVNKGNEL